MTLFVIKSRALLIDLTSDEQIGVVDDAVDDSERNDSQKRIR